MQTLATETMGVAQRYWRMSLVRGIVLIIFGILAIVWPHLTFRLFFLIFGIFAIVEGITLCINAFAHRKDTRSSMQYQGQGRAYYQRSGPVQGQGGATYQRSEPTQGSSTYQRSEPTQGSSTYQRSEPVQGGGAYYQSAPEGAAYQEGTTYREGTGYREGTPHREGAAYRGAEPAWGRATQYVAGSQKSWTISLIEGLLTIICGILALVLPTFVAALAIYVVAAWAMFKGISALMQIRERGWVMALIGVLAIIMSLFLFIDPLGAIRIFLWGVGVFALIAGVVLVLRSLQHNTAASRATPPPEPSY